MIQGIPFYEDIFFLKSVPFHLGHLKSLLGTANSQKRKITFGNYLVLTYLPSTY